MTPRSVFRNLCLASFMVLLVQYHHVDGQTNLLRNSSFEERTPETTIVCKSYAQDSIGIPKYELKLDLLGLSLFALQLPYPQDFRLSTEFEKRIRVTQHISFVLDAEFRLNQIEFERFFTFPYFQTPLWSSGWADQKQVSLMPGLRVYQQLARQSTKHWDWRIFGDIKPEITYQFGTLYPSFTTGGVTKVQDIGVSPRVRGGMSLVRIHRIGLETSIEAFRFKNIGDGNIRFHLFPEMNIVFGF
jgi:hypothetical protein